MPHLMRWPLTLILLMTLSVATQAQTLIINNVRLVDIAAVAERAAAR